MEIDQILIKIVVPLLIGGVMGIAGVLWRNILSQNTQKIKVDNILERLSKLEEKHDALDREVIKNKNDVDLLAKDLDYIKQGIDEIKNMFAR